MQTNQKETIIQTKSCRRCQKSFDMSDEDIKFYEKISPTFNGTKFAIPSPTLCPACRGMRRLSFRNERNLYKRTCDKTGNNIISVYKPSPHSNDSSKKFEAFGLPKGEGAGGYIVYDQKVRWSDSWNAGDYAQEFDFGKSFTEQFDTLMHKVPLCSLYNINSENSDYTNISAYNKNCYMIIESSHNEDCYHGYWLQKSNNCVDCAMTNSSELCYESVDLDNCYKLMYSKYCRECKNSYFLEDCTNCDYCFGCIGQEAKKYMMFNEQKTKDEYENIVSLYLSGNNDQKKTLLNPFISLQQGYGKYTHVRNSSEVTGDYIYDAGNIKDSFEIHDANNVSYSKHVWFHSGDCMDVDTVGYNSFLMYESINTALDAYKNMFCIRCWSGCSNCLYCFNCDSVSNCFGCIGMRNSSYCIFNKQYTKEEYEKQVVKIVMHMKKPPTGSGQASERGEFFHPSLSPFGYNETVAMEQYPVEQTPSPISSGYPPYQGEKLDFGDETGKSMLPPGQGRGTACGGGFEELQKFGFHWSDYIAPAATADRIIEGKDLPPTIDEINDDILKTAVRCEISGKLFRITPQELAFYRKYHISLPRKHPDQRHKERMALRR